MCNDILGTSSERDIVENLRLLRGNSNMETSLILLVVVEIDDMIPSKHVSEPIQEYRNSGAVRQAMRIKIRIDSRGSCGKHSAETACYDTLQHTSSLIQSLIPCAHLRPP